jgi:cytochrome c oxidase subunit 2
MGLELSAAGPDGVLDTADDIRTVGELHVTVNTTYHFELMSRDVVHSFAVPAFRLKQDALPGRTITGWFRPNRVGTYDIQCTQMCGMGHGHDGGANYCRDAAGPRRLADAQYKSAAAGQNSFRPHCARTRGFDVAEAQR